MLRWRECYQKYRCYRGYRGGGRTTDHGRPGADDRGRPQPILGCPSYDCASSSCVHRGTSICGFPSGSGDCYQGKLFPAAAPGLPAGSPRRLPAGALTHRGVAASRVLRRRPLLVPPSGPAADHWQARYRAPVPPSMMYWVRGPVCPIGARQAPRPGLIRRPGISPPTWFDSQVGGGQKPARPTWREGCRSSFISLPLPPALLLALGARHP